MDRWDFDCQKCGQNIGDAWFVPTEWYTCSQWRNRFTALKKVYPKTAFKLDGKLVHLADKSIDPKIAARIIEVINKCYKEGGRFSTFGMSADYLHVVVHPEESIVIWDKTTEAAERKYMRQAKITPHTIEGRGRGRLGYCFDTKCAEDLKYLCDTCGSKLEKVTAEQHPGGEWGIKDGAGRTLREPAPMI